MKKIISVLFVVFNISVFANDSRVLNGGNVVLLSSDTTNVSILEEVLDIHLYKERIDVVVQYLYKNSGKTENVTLGFPIKASVQEYDLDKIEISNFEYIFNGEKIDKYETRVDQKKDGYYYDVQKWYIRNVTFPSNSQIVANVKYSCSYSYGGFEHFFQYIIGSAITWKGPIGKMLIRIHEEKNILINDWEIGSFNKNKLPEKISVIEDGFEILQYSYLPEKNDMLSLYVKDYYPPVGYRNEYGDVFAGWIWDKYKITDNENDLLLFSKYQIQMFINFFYAYHGYQFKIAVLEEFFSLKEFNFYDDADTKYRINDKFSENSFNKIERENIEYLKKLLKRLY